MYYLNSFLVYSVIGFIIESTIFKIKKTKKFSGISYGPVTMIYGLGIVIILLLNKYVLKKIHCNKYLKILLTFIICGLVLTILELCGGIISRLLFNKDIWNYSSKKYNIGKYICLELMIIWGIMGTLYIYVIKPFIDIFIKKIPKKVTYFFSGVFIIDIIFTILNK